MISTPAKWIDKVIMSGPALLFKRLGYKKTGRRFVHVNAESTFRIDFQASQWHNDTHARFTLNIASHFPSPEVASEDRSPHGNVTRVMASARSRIAHLMPAKQDHWWTIATDSNIANIGLEVSVALELFALPYLARVSIIQGLAEYGGYHPQIGKFPSPAVASALVILNRQHDATAIFDEFTANRATLSSYEQAWLSKYGSGRG